MNSWDRECFICGAHFMQENCGCCPMEVDKKIKEHIEKFKNIKPIPFNELVEKLKLKKESQK